MLPVEFETDEFIHRSFIHSIKYQRPFFFLYSFYYITRRVRKQLDNLFSTIRCSSSSSLSFAAFLNIFLPHSYPSSLSLSSPVHTGRKKKGDVYTLASYLTCVYIFLVYIYLRIYIIFSFVTFRERQFQG